MRDASSRPQLGRRALLAGVGATILGGSARLASGHPTPEVGDGQTQTPPPTAEATAADFAPFGHVHVPGTKEVVVDRSTQTAYLATTTGFATVDVADPRHPRVLADRRDLLADRADGPLVQIHDVDVDADRLLVVGPANGVDGAVNAAVRFDVTDPAAPVRESVVETAYPIHNAVLRGDRAYLTANDFERNALVIVDMASGTELGRWSVADEVPGWTGVDPLLWVVHDVTVRDDLAVVSNWDAGTWIVDVSDPTAPATIAPVRTRDPSTVRGLRDDAVTHEYYETPGNDHSAAVSADGTLLGIGTEAWDESATDRQGGPGGIDLWEVADPTTPVHLGRIDPPTTSDASLAGVWTTAHNFAFYDSRLYSTWYRGGVRVHDVRSPATPRRLAAWRDDARTSFWAAHLTDPGSCFVASTRENFGPLGSTDESVTGGLYTFPDPPATARPTATELPGFGVLGGLVGFGLGAWRLARRMDD